MLYENGYDIKILNTINFNKSMKYNPLAYLRSEKDILKLIQTFIAIPRDMEKILMEKNLK